MQTHLLSPVQWCSQKHTMKWYQGWRRTVRHKLSGHFGWLRAHRRDIIISIYWPLFCGHETGWRDFCLTKKGMRPAALSSSIIFFSASPLTEKFLSVGTFFIITPPIRAARSTEEWDCKTGSKSTTLHRSIYHKGNSNAPTVAGSRWVAFYRSADKDASDMIGRSGECSKGLCSPQANP